MPTSEQVRELVAAGLDYAAAGRRLGIPAGQAYLIATGQPADGGDSTSEQQRDRGGLRTDSQRLSNPSHENPTAKDLVRRWIAARVAGDAQMRAAGARRTPEPPPVAEAEATQDAITVLGRDHNQVKYLLKQLQALPGHRTGGTAEQTRLRKSIVDLIAARLAAHEAVEQEYLWPTVRRALPDGDDRADAAVHQEQQGTDTLAALGRLAPDTDEFDELVERLVLQLRRHVACEEDVFLRLRPAVSEDELAELGRRMLAAKKTAPPLPTATAPARARAAAGDRPAERAGPAGSKKPEQATTDSEGDQ